MSRLLFLFDTNMTEINSQLMQAFELHGIPTNSLCVNHPEVHKCISRDRKFDIHHVPTALWFSDATPGVVDKYETPEHFRVLLDRLYDEFPVSRFRDDDDHERFVVGTEGVETKDQAARPSVPANDLHTTHTTEGRAAHGEDITGLPSQDVSITERVMDRGQSITGKHRPSGRKTGPRGVTAYDALRVPSGHPGLHGFPHGVPGGDIASMAKQYNNAIDAETYLSTQQSREKGIRNLGRAPPSTGNDDAVETVKTQSKDREEEGLRGAVGKQDESDEGDGEEENNSEQGKIAEGMGAEEDGIDAMVRAINGDDSNFVGKETVDEIQGGTKSRAQREKSKAITNAASAMLRERELSDDATKRPPMHIR
jgi:hypothetical protein